MRGAVSEPSKEVSRSPGGNVWVRARLEKGRGGVGDHAPPSNAWVGKSDQMRGKVKTGGVSGEGGSGG